jgi:hypothetical protein
MNKTLCIVAALALHTAPVGANDEISVPAQDQQAISVTIYNTDLALIRDRRQVSIPQGVHTLAFREVSAQIKPETALLRSPDLQVLEQNFEYDLLTPQSLLRRYIGREVTLVRQHPTAGEEQSLPARVLSAGDGVVLQVGNRIETEISGRLIYPDVPSTLRDRPTLAVQVDSTTAGTRKAELSYLTGGLSWQADYVAELNDADDRLDLSGWVTLTNASGVRYPKAQLQLVAGNVHRVQPDMAARTVMKEGMTLAATPPPMAEEPMFAYHLYTLARPTDIEDNQKKQVTLLQATGVACRKRLVLDGQDTSYRAPSRDLGRTAKVGVFVELDNDTASGLGQPIPGGTVRVYKKDGRGFLQFVGEDRVVHTPEKETIRLQLGEAFDVTAEKQQIDFNKIAGTGAHDSIFESAYRIQLHNAKAEQVVVKVREPLPGDWEMLEESAPHHQESAHTVSWLVTVPPKDSATLSYRVRVHD